MVASNRPRIVMAIPTLRAGGAERVFSTLAAHLDPERLDVRLVAFDLSGAAFLDRVPSHVDVIDLATARVRHALPEFARLLRRLRPAAVVSTLEHLNKALCASRVLWPKEVRHVVRATHVRHLDRTVDRFAARLLYRSADGLVFQSSAMQAAFDRRLGYRHPNAVVIENPVDVEAVRAAAGAPVPRGQGAVELVAAGTLDPRKGFDLLVQAMARAPTAARLTILGDGPERTRLDALIASLGLQDRVRLAGHQANPYPFVARADALVLSSRSEGFPNVVLEALALGTPVVATPVAGLETFLADVPHCQVAREVGVEALTEALDRFVAAPRGRTPGEVVAPFEAAAIARRWEAYLLDLIAGRRAA